eukprot:COSAG01_NODE_548_length_15614_cov_14.361199_6_plen_96_part_00
MKTCSSEAGRARRRRCCRKVEAAGASRIPVRLYGTACWAMWNVERLLDPTSTSLLYTTAVVLRGAGMPCAGCLLACSLQPSCCAKACAGCVSILS